MDEPPLWFLLLHVFRSRLKLHFTKIAVTIPITVEHTNGKPYPTPNTALSGSTVIKIVVAMATTRRPTPQHQLKTCIILRNMPLASYLFESCALKAF